MTRSINLVRRRLLLGAAASSMSALCPAFAASPDRTYPNRPLTFICPWPTGGTADTTMRVVAEELQKNLKQEIIFRNVAGVSGMMGARLIARAKPDGYTIGQVPVSVMRFAELGMVRFDPIKDFSWLARVAGQTFGIVVRADSPFRTLDDLIAAARANPGKLIYASAGLAGATHVGMEEFLQAAGIQMQHLGHKGGAPALTSLVGGQVDVLADSSSWAPLVQAGQLRLLATWGDKRLQAFPGVPTLKDAGFNVVVDAPNGIGAPAGLPAHVERRLHKALEAAILSPRHVAACEKLHMPMMYQDAKTFRAYLLSQGAHQRWLIDRLNLREQVKNS